MSNPIFTGANPGDLADATAYSANWDLAANSFLDIGPWVITGLVPSAGTGLSVSVTSGTASIGGRVTKPASFTISGLTDASTNHLYLKQDGTATSNTTGTAPANSVKLGTATTSGGNVTAVGVGRTSGRQQFVPAYSLVPGGPSAGLASAGHHASINLASWAAAAAEGVSVFGTLPNGAGVLVNAPATTAANTVQPTADAASGLLIMQHSATQGAPIFDCQTNTGARMFTVFWAGAGQACNIRARNDADAALNLYGNSPTQTGAVLQVLPDGATVMIKITAAGNFQVGTALNAAGGATPQLGFFNVTPVGQQANASQATINSVTDTNAKAALQSLYNALKTLGLCAATA